jgi:hypothetical protein
VALEIRSRTGTFSVVGVIVDDPRDALRRAWEIAEYESVTEVTIVDALGTHHDLESFATAYNLTAVI